MVFRKMDVTFNTGSHDIVITSSIAAELRSFLSGKPDDISEIFILSDENTHKHCYPLIADQLPKNHRNIVVGAGELNKNIHTCQVVWEQLLQSGADRRSLLINLGGGMLSDLGGFAAATYKRGIRFLNVPTSLLGMVDASAGGKTGVDLNHYKNMIGLFAFPEKVIVDPVFLDSLPEKEWKNGLAEMLKHGLIADRELWTTLSHAISAMQNSSITDQLKATVISLLGKAIKVKADIVKKDPLEKEERKFLNFGHTTGHALETYSLKHDDHPLSHGESVAAGMVCESFISMKLCGLSTSSLEEISNVITGFFPHYNITKAAQQEMIHIVKADKKSEHGNVTFALLKDIGEPLLKSGITHDLLLESFHFYNSLRK